MKSMEVERKTTNIGRLFFCCSRYCGFFEWSNISPYKRKSLQNERQSSGVKDEQKVIPIEGMSSFPKLSLKLLNKWDVEIFLNLTIHKG